MMISWWLAVGVKLLNWGRCGYGTGFDVWGPGCSGSNRRAGVAHEQPCLPAPTPYSLLHRRNSKSVLCIRLVDATEKVEKFPGSLESNFVFLMTYPYTRTDVFFSVCV